jgi:hypothetical protein
MARGMDKDSCAANQGYTPSSDEIQTTLAFDRPMRSDPEEARIANHGTSLIHWFSDRPRPVLTSIQTGVVYICTQPLSKCLSRCKSPAVQPSFLTFSS